MLASLTGTLLAINQDSVIIEVHGVGFQVFVPGRVLEDLGGRGQEVTLFTHLHVRENELSLYGCRTAEELELFRTLLGVSGIGPRVALSMLSALPPDELQMAIVHEDVTLLARVPGIGPKTAKKLVFDLKDKIAEGLPAVQPRRGAAPSDADADLIAALTGLGYSIAEAQDAIGALPREPLPLEERVRLALAYFAS